MSRMQENFEQDAIARAFARQRQSRWVAKGSTTAERLAKLARLRAAVVAHASEFNAVLGEDFGRPPEAPASMEVAVILADLDHVTANLGAWMQPVTVEPAPLLPGPPPPDARRFIQHEGRGIVLIFAPWNQPLMLALQPLIAAVAAGNTAIVKPNELAPASSRLVSKIIREAFSEEDVAVFEGGIDLADALLELPVDHIFFTGSPAIGRKVAAAAARNLSTTTLELGGKSPAIIDSTADLAAAAAAIASAKYYNAGQICITFDHVWIEEDLRDAFVGHFLEWIDANLYVEGELRPGALSRIVNHRNFDRLAGYVTDAVERGATLIGGRRFDPSSLEVEPGILVDVPLDAAIMRDEIFGPLLPVLTYRDVAEVIAHIQAGEKPLALYAFTTDAPMVERLLAETSSGGVTTNAFASHAFESTLPFGGVGNSGSGSYHGVYGFRALSHARAVVITERPFNTVAALSA